MDSIIKTSYADHYRENGYLVVKNLLPPAYVQRLIDRIEQIAAGNVTEFPRAAIELEPEKSAIDRPAVRKINGCAEHDPVFRMHAQHEMILDIVETFIGPNIKLYGSQCFMKPPGGVEKPYHQDSAYFPVQPMELVTCWTALDDVTTSNGCMWVIPGGHRLGLLDHSQPWQVGDRTDKQVPPKLLDNRREVPITMPAGSCSFHHSLLPHRSAPNNSTDSRRGLAVHYMSAKSQWMRDDTPPAYPLLRGREYSDCV